MNKSILHVALYVFWCFCTQVALAQNFTIYHTDIYGSPVAATSFQNGALKWREQYAPFGEEQNQSVEGIKDDIGFTGKQFDSEIGVNYFNARYYNPRLGRFISVDPAGVDVGKIETFNRYSYAINNPYRYTDPSGEIPFDTILDVGFLIYDSSKAAYYGTMAYTTGNPAYTTKFVGAMGDVAEDIVGVATPYVPTIAIKVAKTGKQIAKNSDEVAAVASTAKKSVRKDLYPTRARKPVKQAMIEKSKAADGNVKCDKCGDTVPENGVTMQHEPALVETHNKVGWNTDQATRNQLYNDTITGVNCKKCQAIEGGSMTQTYRTDTGPDFKPRGKR